MFLKCLKKKRQKKTQTIILQLHHDLTLRELVSSPSCNMAGQISLGLNVNQGKESHVLALNINSLINSFSQQLSIAC